MCGILWCITDDNRTSQVADAHFQRLKHRGPDATRSMVVKGGHFIGTHRLAIINTHESGNQPFELDGSFLACNGQIYNYKELANGRELRSDVDVILHMKQHFDIVTLAQLLDGDFAFVLIDNDANVYLARDPVGVRPLFYGLDRDNKIVCAASEVKAILDMPGVVRCEVFPPGHVYDAMNGVFTKFTQIYPLSAPSVSTSYDDAVATVKKSLERAVKKRITNSDRPIAFLCSGGIDSSVVLAIAYKLLQNKEGVHMFSIEYVHDGSRSDDSFYASMLASQFGIKHTRVKFNWEDVQSHIKNIAEHIETYDPNTIRASVPMYFLAKYIRENTDYKVILSGEGADEVFMGYNIFRNVGDPAAANEETYRLVRNLHMFDALRADRTFNAHGLEVRVPFLDKDLLYDVFRLDGVHKMYKNGMEKSLLRDAFKDVPELAQTRILQREKERFSDGCGFGYVPSLLKHWTAASDLASREKAEKETYLEWFNNRYPEHTHLITKRVNPAWCHVQGGELLSF